MSGEPAPARRRDDGPTADDGGGAMADQSPAGVPAVPDAGRGVDAGRAAAGRPGPSDADEGGAVRERGGGAAAATGAGVRPVLPDRDLLRDPAPGGTGGSERRRLPSGGAVPGGPAGGAADPAAGLARRDAEGHGLDLPSLWREALERVACWARSNSLWLVHFNSGSCNGCDIEILATLTPRYDVERFGVKLQGSPRHADVLICTGPVTRQARDRLLRVYEQMPEPKYVLAVGSCAISGGAFQGCYNVVG